MFYRLLALLLLFTTGLSAQHSTYRLQFTVGSQSAVTESLRAKPATSISLERVSMLGVRTNFFVGGGLRYGSFISGIEDQTSDFIIGQVPVNFNFTQTYTPEELNAFLSVGLEYLAGNFRFRGALHPALRLHSRITAAERQDFWGAWRPRTYAKETVRPGDLFTWSGIIQQQLAYNSVFQLRASLEVDFALRPDVRLGVGVQRDVVDYYLTNTAVDWVTRPNSSPPNTIPGEFQPYEVGRANLQSYTGYVSLRLAL